MKVSFFNLEKMNSENPKRKKSKEQQSQLTEARTKMKEQVVESKKVYKRRFKHRGEED